MPWLAHKGLIPEESAILRWLRHLQEAAKLVGRQFNVARRLEGEPIRAGFEEVKHEVRKVSTTAAPASSIYPELSRTENALSLSFPTYIPGYKPILIDFMT